MQAYISTCLQGVAAFDGLTFVVISPSYECLVWYHFELYITELVIKDYIYIVLFQFKALLHYVI